MANQGAAVKSAKNIDNAFAASQQQVYNDRPFFGAVFRIQHGQEVYLQYVDKNDRLTLTKFLEQRNISQGQFLIRTEPSEGQPIEIPIVVDKNGKSIVSNPFLDNLPAGISRPATDTSAVKDQLEAEVIRLNGQLEDVKEKRSQAEEELYKYKRENTAETGDLKEEHRNKLDRIKENHRQQVDDLKEEVRQKEWEIKMKEMELMSENGSPSGWDKVVDKFLSDDFLSTIATQVGGMMQQQGNLQPTPEQIKGAFTETAAQQMPQQNGQQANEARNNPSETEPQPELSPEQQMQAAKEKIGNHLKQMALNTLMGNIEYGNYAQAVKDQLALNAQQGIELDAKQWVEMAKMLAEKAVQKEIDAEKVAKIIEPALDILPAQARMMAGAVKPKAAANMLFKGFNIEASSPTKDLVIEVLDQLLNPKKQSN